MYILVCIGEDGEFEGIGRISPFLLMFYGRNEMMRLTDLDQNQYFVVATLGAEHSTVSPNIFWAAKVHQMHAPSDLFFLYFGDIMAKLLAGPSLSCFFEYQFSVSWGKRNTDTSDFISRM